jgi:hypothetical protein
MSAEFPTGDGGQEEQRPLTDGELDAVLRRADEELLRHIAATVDVDAVLRGDVPLPENPGPAEQP